MIGQHVRPHTLLTRSIEYSTKCMEEEEARSNNPPLNFVDPTRNAGTFEDAMAGTAGSYYYDPNDFYRAVRATDGVWAPIRSPCMKSGAPADVTSDLNATCQASTAGRRVDGGGNPTDDPLPAVNASYTDADGRLFCDPRGRTRRQQIEEAMREIVGAKPFVLVE